MKIAVVGLGYVGLPLSLQFARSCVTVLGIDVDSKKVELLNNGQSYIKHISADGIREMVDEGSSRDDRFQPDQRGGGGDYLRANAAHEEPRAGHLVRS